MLPSTVDMVRVESSNLEAVGYEIAESRLWVRFKNGSLYRYEAVPEQVYRDFLNAPSKGKYHFAEVKSKYEYHKE